MSVSIELGNIKHVIEDQIKTYYPARLEDFQSGKIDVEVRIIQGNGDDIWFDQLKKKSSIADPACALIMGFNEAILFLQLFMVDPL